MKQALVLISLVALSINMPANLIAYIFKMNMEEGLDLCVGISAFIPAIGMIYITYIIYSLSNEDTKKNSYVDSISRLYSSIKDDFYSLSILDDATSDDDYQHYIRKSKVKSSLLCFYSERFPGYNEFRRQLHHIGMLINHNPIVAKNYEEYMNCLFSFFESVRKKKANGDFVFNVDGGYQRRDF